MNPAASGGFASTAPGLAFGSASIKISRRFPTSSLHCDATPVIIPPGRARLTAYPTATGSPTNVNTIGIVLVALRTALTRASSGAQITSTLSRTSSATSAGNRVESP